VLLITGVIALFLAIVPGFPKLVFILLGAGLLTGGALLHPRGWRAFFGGADNAEAQKPVDAERPDSQFTAAAPLVLEVAVASRGRFDSAQFERENRALRDSLHQDLGIIFPLAQVRFAEDLEEDHYVIRIFEVPTANGTLRVGDGCIDTAHLATVLRRHAAQFLGIQEVNSLIANMTRDYPDLVKEMLRVVTLQKVADVLRRLAEEGVSIRNLRDVFESLADAGQREKDVVLLTEYARIGLKRYLSNRHADTDRALQAFLLHPQLEDKIRQSIRVTGGSSHLALDPDLAARILSNLRTQRADLSTKSSKPPALLTSLDVRRYVRKLIETEFFDVPVLSYHELAPEVTVRPVAQLNA
jgi:type III secretion protein V